MMDETLRDEALSQVAATLDVPAEAVRILPVADAGTDELRFFEIEVEDEDGSEQYAIGAAIGPNLGPDRAGAAGTRFEFDREALTARAVAALGRSGDATRVARTFGLLEGADEPARPILGPVDAEHLQPAWRALVTMPAATVDGGAQRYTFWVTSGQIPLWRVVLTVAADGSHTFERTEIWDLLEAE